MATDPDKCGTLALSSNFTATFSFVCLSLPCQTSNKSKFQGWQVSAVSVVSTRHTFQGKQSKLSLDYCHYAILPSEASPKQPRAGNDSRDVARTNESFDSNQLPNVNVTPVLVLDEIRNP